MADTITKEMRSLNMSHIKGADTSIEIKVRRYLFSQGFRFRKNDSRYPGKPDIVLPKYHTVVFIHGCFWHRHLNCKFATSPKTNVEYWNSKFQKNIENDALHIKQLQELGWRVIVLWECEINRDFNQLMEQLVRSILEPHERD